MRIGLDLLFLGPRAGGAGRYARELPAALLEAEPASEIEVFLGAGAPEDLREEPWWGRVRTRALPARGALSRLAAQHALLPLRARGLDVLHSPANVGPGLTAPGTARVITLLDLIPWHHPAEWEGSERAQRALRRQAGYAVRRADRVFAISRHAAADIAATLGVSGERIDVTPLGVRAPSVRPTPEAQLRERLGLGSGRVLLCVAQKRPYKNLGVLVAALPALPEDVMLVLPGEPTAYEQQLREGAEALGVSHRVRFPPWASEADLEGLYALAAGFALPSLIEGFGLPVLEAMARGVAVACAKVAALPEVAGGAALLFDPHRQQEVDAALRRLIGDSGDLAARGRARAAALSWRRSGEAHLAGYRRAAARG